MNGYDNYLISYGLWKFGVKIYVITNGIEKYMAFMIHNNLVFTDSMQFMNSSLENLVKDLDDDLKYLSEEFGSKKFRPLKTKRCLSIWAHGQSWKILRKKLPDKKCFYRSLKDGTASDNGKILDGHITDEEHLTCSKTWNGFNIKNMGDYQDRYLKKHVLLLANVFERFIDTCLKFYKLDPCDYFNSLELS